MGLLGFFFISLANRPRKKLSELIFMTWILLLLVTELSFLVYSRGNVDKHLVLINSASNIHLLHPFFLYLYVSSFTNSKFKFTRKTFYLLIPWIVLLGVKLYTELNVGIIEYDDQLVLFDAQRPLLTVFFFYKYAVMLAYIYLSHQIVVKHRAENSSREEKLRNLWVRNLVSGTFYLFIAVLVIQVLRVISPSIFQDRMLITSIVVTGFVYILLYMANSRAYLFVSEKKKIPEIGMDQEGEKNSRITEETLQVYKKTEQYIQENKSYLNGTLTLNEMAQELGFPQRQLSNSINSITGKSFIHYLNSYRVDHLKRLLDDPQKQHFTILSLAEESGFNSKTTLVRIFKQHTGMTPSEYLNQDK